MSYFIETTNCNFLLLKENENKAMNALQQLYKKGFDTFYIDQQKMYNCKNLTQLLSLCYIYVKSDYNANYIDIEFDNTYLNDRDNETILKTIAPFVEPGSYIEMIGEDGNRWRYFFEENKMKTGTSYLNEIEYDYE